MISWRPPYRVWIESVMRVLLFVLLLTSLGVAQGKTLRVCIGDVDNPPLSFPSHDGQAQYLIRQAASEQGWTVEFEPVPWRRCRAGVESGRYDAAGTATATPSNREFMQFPLSADHVNDSQGVGEFKVVVFRAQGTAVGWDGQAFTGLASPVLYNAGFVAVGDRLQQLQIPRDDSAQLVHQMMQMIMRGRAQVGVGQAFAVQYALRDPEFAGRIEVLPVPFMQATLFLGVSKGFYAQETAAIEAIWHNIGRLRAAPQWQQLAPKLAN